MASSEHFFGQYFAIYQLEVSMAQSPMDALLPLGPDPFFQLYHPMTLPPTFTALISAALVSTLQAEMVPKNILGKVIDYYWFQ